MFNELSSAMHWICYSKLPKAIRTSGFAVLGKNILEGPNARLQLTGKPSQATLTLAQLLKFNSVKHARKTEQCTRHIKSQETPLPVT